MRIAKFFLFLFCSCGLFAQKTDHHWLFGYGNTSLPTDSTHGTTHVTFNNDSTSVYSDGYIGLDFLSCNTSICDEEGNLLFYSNCMEIFNSDNEPITNSEDFNYYPYHVGWEDDGLQVDQGILSMKSVDGLNHYYVFHVKIDWEEVNGLWDLISPALHYSLLDMDANGGLGDMIEKDVPVLTDTLGAGMMTATKHANGRDWWIITPEYNTNRYYRMLLTPEGIQVLSNQEVGEPTISGLGQACFSPDGSWYVRNNLLGGPAQPDYLDIYRFDRCTGMLSNHIRFPYGSQVNAGGGAVISSNNRFVYVLHRNWIYQYDLEAADIQASKVTVATYDGFTDQGLATTFFLGQLAPDGKIYINCTNGVSYMHTIDYPDKQGTACKVMQHGIKLPTYNSFSLPNHPNYRLGPLDGSPCDTLGLDNIPVAKFTFEKTSGGFLKAVFRDLSYYNPTEWHWDFGDGTTSTEKHPTHIYQTNGIYEVCLYVSNENASDTYCRTVQFGTVSSLEELALDSSIVVAPNPASSSSNFYLPTNIFHATLTLYTPMGQLVLTQRLSAGWNMVPLEGIAPDLYFYEVKDEEKILQSGKLVKVE